MELMQHAPSQTVDSFLYPTPEVLATFASKNAIGKSSIFYQTETGWAAPTMKKCHAHRAYQAGDSSQSVIATSQAVFATFRSQRQGRWHKGMSHGNFTSQETDSPENGIHIPVNLAFFFKMSQYVGVYDMR